jgi:hypothetical protein
MYEFVGYLSLKGANNSYDMYDIFDTCWIFGCLWTDNSKFVFVNNGGYWELEIISTKEERQ